MTKMSEPEEVSRIKSNEHTGLKKKQKRKAIVKKSNADDIQGSENGRPKKKMAQSKAPGDEAGQSRLGAKMQKLKNKERSKDSVKVAGIQPTPSGYKRKQVRKQTYNKEAIERMKARQLARKEKQMRQDASDAPTPDAKQRRRKLPVRLDAVQLNFTDDDTMAQFEGVWVPREETGRLQSAREDLEKRNLPTEKVERRMKQLVRREHRKLKIRLIAAQTKTERAARERQQFLTAQQTPRMRRRLPGRACGLVLQEGERLARFDGFWVATEAVPRLEQLQLKLAAEGRPENEARRLLRKARRQEERKVKTSGRLLCSKCGGRGHLGSDCKAEPIQAAVGTVCFRCGEAGHRLSDCPKKGQIAGLPFATCYLCKEQGHMSRECPQAATDCSQRAGRTSAATACPATAGQSWRGLAHDAGDTTEVAPAPAKRKREDKSHVRFD